MPIRVSFDQVNSYLFRRQCLSSEMRRDGVLATVQRVGPIRATPTLTPYLSLWARLPGFEQEQLDEALYQHRSLVRIPCMHARLFVVPTADVVSYYQATRPTLQRGLDEFVDRFLATTSPTSYGDSSLERADITQRVLEVASTRGPISLEEMAQFLPILSRRLFHDPEDPDAGYTRLGARLIPAMCAQGLLVRAKARGNWKSSQYTYSPYSAWLPEVDLNSQSPKEGLRRIVLSYLGAFGPATIGDMVHWFGGISRHQIVAAVMGVAPRITRLQVDGLPGEFLALKETVPELLAERPGAAETVVALLPPRDSYPAAYSDTSRFLAPFHRDRVFDRVGEATGAVWQNGEIIGTWWIHLSDERIVIRLLELANAETIALVGEQARRLGEFLDFPSLDIDIGHDLDPDAGDKTPEPSFAYITLGG